MAEETIIVNAGVRIHPENRTANTAARNPQDGRTANSGIRNLPESRTANIAARNPQDVRRVNTGAQNPQENRAANSGIQMAQDGRIVNNADQKIPANRAVNLSRVSTETIIEAARKFQPRNLNFRRNHFLLLRLILHTMATGVI
jgi:uncharacterized protein YabE (DUF348 family)